MKARTGEERRRFLRHESSASLRGTELPSLLPTPASETTFRGQIRDIGAGGLCILTDELLHVSHLARCEIPLPGLPVAIPTLAQIRWIRRDPVEATHFVGLQFLL